MRSQWCREHIKEAARNCGLQKSVVSDCEQVSDFCAEHSDMSECSTRAILALIRVKNNPVRERAVLLAENALKGTTPTGGKKKTRLTEREIKKIIDQADREIRSELSDVSETTESSLGPEPKPESESPSNSVKPADAATIPDRVQPQLPAPVQLQQPELPSHEQPPAPLHQSLTHEEKEAITEHFLSVFLTPEHTKFLDNTIGAGTFESYLEAIKFLIDSEMGSPISNKAPVVLPDKPISEPTFQELNIPWKFPTRPLSHAEKERMCAEFIKVAFEPVLQDRLHKVTIVRRLPNDMEALKLAVILALPPTMV